MPVGRSSMLGRPKALSVRKSHRLCLRCKDWVSCMPSFTRLVCLFLLLLVIKCYTEPRVKPSVPCLLAPPFGQGPGGSLHSFSDTDIPIPFEDCESEAHRCFWLGNIAWWFFLFPRPQGVSIPILTLLKLFHGTGAWK